MFLNADICTSWNIIHWGIIYICNFFSETEDSAWFRQEKSKPEKSRPFPKVCMLESQSITHPGLNSIGPPAHPFEKHHASPGSRVDTPMLKDLRQQTNLKGRPRSHDHARCTEGLGRAAKAFSVQEYLKTLFFYKLLVKSQLWIRFPPFHKLFTLIIYLYRKSQLLSQCNPRNYI